MFRQDHKIKLAVVTLIAIAAFSVYSQSASKIALGSNTAKNGIRNEDEIEAKFNNWNIDVDAASWLAAMEYKTSPIETVTAAKPYGENADVEVYIKTKTGERTEGISIKLVNMPKDVEWALKLFAGKFRR